MITVAAMPPVTGVMVMVVLVMLRISRDCIYCRFRPVSWHGLPVSVSVGVPGTGLLAVGVRVSGPAWSVVIVMVRSAHDAPFQVKRIMTETLADAAAGMPPPRGTWRRLLGTTPVSDFSNLF